MRVLSPLFFRGADAALRTENCERQKFATLKGTLLGQPSMKLLMTLAITLCFTVFAAGEHDGMQTPGSSPAADAVAAHPPDETGPRLLTVSCVISRADDKSRLTLSNARGEQRTLIFTGLQYFGEDARGADSCNAEAARVRANSLPVVACGCRRHGIRFSLDCIRVETTGAFVSVVENKAYSANRNGVRACKREANRLRELG